MRTLFSNYTIAANVAPLAEEGRVKLSEAQLAQYRDLGFAAGNRLLEGPAFDRLGAEIEAEIARLPAGRRPENMPSLHYHNGFLRDLFLSDPFVDIAEQILGPDIALFTTYVISKQAGDGLPVHWHQDAAYFPIEPMETFTLWLAVDDSTRENGCMRVLPGSHRERRLIPHGVYQDDGSVLPVTLKEMNLDIGTAADVELKAGHYSVHDCFILHGSGPNRSPRRRCGITIKYVPTHVRLDRGFRSPTGFDWNGIRLYLARGKPGAHRYAN